MSIHNAGLFSSFFFLVGGWELRRLSTGTLPGGGSQQQTVLVKVRCFLTGWSEQANMEDSC